MSDIRFYHLQKQTLEEALPPLLLRILSQGLKAIVRFADEEAVQQYNDFLWSYDPHSFLPHGGPDDSYPERQPIYLTHEHNENPNGATVLVLCGIDTVPENLSCFLICCDFVDGADPSSVEAARRRWKLYKAQGHSLTYWQQSEQGRWEQKSQT